MPDQTDSRFAVYLIPPYAVARTVIQVHTVLRKQFGFQAADRFQVHATIKGFFKKAPGPLPPLVERLDQVFADQRPFPVHFSGYRIDAGGIGLDIAHRDGELNPDLLALRERVVEAVFPHIADDCDFVESDLGPPFRAHITLAFRDLRPAMHADVLAYLEDAELPTEPFMANTFHFLEFFSDDWGGDWHRSLTWRLLKTWRLPAA